jgi:ESCRT-I complex subunit VPS37
VDAAGRLSFPSLLHWAPSQSSLVAVVAEALSELSGLQHAGAQSPQPSSSGRASPADAPAGQQRTQHGQAHHQQRQQQYQEAAVPSSAAVLQGMSAEQLHLLLVDERAYRDLLQQLAAQSASGAVQRQLRLGNADLAAANLARESEIAELRNQIAIIRSSEYALAKEAFDGKQARQAAVLDKIAPQQLIAALAAAAEALDAESEELNDRFCAGDVTIEAFQQQHLKLRQAYHERDIKRQAAEQTLM